MVFASSCHSVRRPFTDERRYVAGPGNPEVEPGPQDADIVWRYDMMEELGVFPHNGTRSHALIVGDLVYVGTCNGMDWTHVNIPSPQSLSRTSPHTFHQRIAPYGLDEPM